MSNRERARKNKTIAESIRAASGIVPPPKSYAGKAADIMIVDDPHDETVMQPAELERLLARADGDQVAVERFERSSVETFEFTVDGVRWRCVARIGQINFEPRREARQAMADRFYGFEWPDGEGRLTTFVDSPDWWADLSDPNSPAFDDLGLMGRSPISPNSGEIDQHEANLTNNDGEVVKSTKKWSDSPTFSEKCQSWLIRTYRRLTRAGGGAGGATARQNQQIARGLDQICPACGYLSPPKARTCTRWRCGAEL